MMFWYQTPWKKVSNSKTKSVRGRGGGSSGLGAPALERAGRIPQHATAIPAFGLEVEGENKIRDLLGILARVRRVDEIVWKEERLIQVVLQRRQLNCTSFETPALKRVGLDDSSFNVQRSTFTRSRAMNELVGTRKAQAFRLGVTFKFAESTTDVLYFFS